MRMTTLVLGAAVASLIAAAVAPAAAQDSILVPNLTYRTGPFSNSGIPIANGIADYFAMINARDGGIGGTKITVEECETGYRNEKGVECYEALKSKKPVVITPYSIEALQCYATADVGVIAYERPACQGMIVNETLIVEIVRPGSGEPVADGDVGEVVVTSLNPDYPMIRLATGDLTAAIAGVSPCGRTNLCIKGWLGRADQSTKIKGLFVHPAQLMDVARRHPELGRVQLLVTRAGEQDTMTLMAECAEPRSGLADAVAATLQSVTALKGTVQLVAPGSLAKDDRLIVDARSY